jgi:hypothetical protein
MSHATLVNDGLLWLTIATALLLVIFVHAVIGALRARRPPSHLMPPAPAPVD